MQGNDPERAAIADPHGRHWAVVNGTAKTKAGRRQDPAISWREDPSAVMIGQPTPRRGSDKRIAEERILVPAAVAEGRPAEAHAKRPPAISVAAHRKPRAVGVKIAEARRIIWRVHVLRGIVRGSHDAVNAPRNPAVEIVGNRSASAHPVG